MHPSFYLNSLNFFTIKIYFTFLLNMSAQRQYRTDAHTYEEISAAVEELLGKLTLKEKLGLMTQHPGFDVSHWC